MTDKKKSPAIEVYLTEEEGIFRDREGQLHRLPDHFDHLPPGDATLTRRVKAAGTCYAVVFWKKRRKTSLGVWADGETIQRIREELEAERETEGYKKQLASSRRRAEKKQDAYVEDFQQAIVDYLAFTPKHDELAREMAAAVAAHATPVGSGTVARTQRIPIEERARAAVIAWMRHETTNYDNLFFFGYGSDRREVARSPRRLSSWPRTESESLSDPSGAEATTEGRQTRSELSASRRS